MTIYSKRLLSGSTNGQPIAVTAVSPSTAHTIHTAVTETGANQMDEVYIYAYNTATANKQLIIRWGASATGQGIRHITQSIPYLDGLHLVVPGLPLQNANTVGAYATAADNLAIVGYVIRAT